jgi:CHAD domain-containing protein
VSDVHREREIKLDVPVGFRMPDLAELGLSVRDAEERRLHTVYWDTPDLRLIRWGYALRHRDGEGWTLKVAGSEAGGLLVRDEHRFDGAPHHPPEAAVDLVRAYVRTAPLVPAVRLRTQRRAIGVHDADGRRLAELDDDLVAVHRDRRVAGRFREIEVEAVDDCPDHLVDGIAARLRTAGAVVADSTSKMARALGDRASGPPEVIVEALDRSSTAAATARRAIAASVLRLLRHDPGVRLGRDPEDVHQARVATRRLRSDLRTFGPLLDDGWTSDLRQELRWLASQLGAVRDAEVLRDRLRGDAARLPEEDRPEADALAAVLEAEVDSGRGQLLASLREPRYLELLDALVAAAHQPALTEHASRPAREVLPGLMARPWARLQRDARRLRSDSTDRELHAVRIRAKRCRYAAEAAAPVGGAAVAALARALAGLQEVLGAHQDAVVAAAWLRERASRGPHAFAAGQLWALERAAAEVSRGAWPAAWKDVVRAAKKLRL